MWKHWFRKSVCPSCWSVSDKSFGLEVDAIDGIDDFIEENW